MKKIIAILIVAMFLTLPVLSFDQEANLYNVRLEFKGYAEKPVIDGVLDEFGYSKVDIGEGDVSYGGNDDELKDAAKAMEYDIYASYDEDYVYMFITTDTKHYNNDGSGNWDQAGVQFALSNIDNVGDNGYTDLVEFIIGRASTNGELVTTYYFNHEDLEELDLTPGTDFQIVLDGNKLNYEIRIPANTFFTGGKLQQGKQFTICIVLCQYNEGYIHTQIASGVSNGKAVEQYAKITLGAPIEKPVPPAPEPEPERVVEVVVDGIGGGTENVHVPAPAPAPAPQTGDATIIMMFVLIIAAGVGARIIVKQTRK